MNSVFHSGLLNRYQLVNGPGTYIVRVAYTVSIKNMIMDATPRLLIPLKVITPDNLKLLIDILNEEDPVPFSRVGNLFLTGAIFEDKIDYSNIPKHGDSILATFDYIDDNRLVCTHLEQLPREELDYIRAEELIKFNSKLLNLMKK
jgi:hypothetical protein